MKHLLSLIAVAILITPAFGQLQVKQESTDLAFKSQYMSIQKVGEGYDALFTDTGHTGSMVIHLGDNLEQSVTSYRQIGEWFASAPKKGTLTIADKDGGDLTFYKQNESVWMITEGDGEYARKFYNDAVLGAVAGGMRAGSNASKAQIVNTPKISYLKKAHFSEDKIQQIFYGTTPTEEPAE